MWEGVSPPFSDMTEEEMESSLRMLTVAEKQLELEAKALEMGQKHQEFLLGLLKKLAEIQSEENINGDRAINGK